MLGARLFLGRAAATWAEFKSLRHCTTAPLFQLKFSRHRGTEPLLKILAPPRHILAKKICDRPKFAPMSRIFQHTVFSPITFLLKVPVSCLLSPVSCLLSVVSCFLSPISCLLSLISCLWSLVSCLKSLVSSLLSPVFCLLSLVSCFLSYVSCLTSPVSCLTCPACTAIGAKEFARNPTKIYTRRKTKPNQIEIATSLSVIEH